MGGTLGRWKTFEDAPIAQLDRASVYGTEGYPFESDWAYESRYSGFFSFLAWLYKILFVIQMWKAKRLTSNLSVFII